MKSVFFCCIALGLFTLAACSQNIHLRDSWEKRAKSVGLSCESIEEPWILPVKAERRQEAIALLTSDDSLKIDSAKIPYWVDVETGSQPISARTILAEEIAALRKRRTNAYELREDSFSKLDEEHLAKFITLEGSEIPDLVSPYLIRAVAKHEYTGAFFGEACEDGVHIFHGSLGRKEPATMRLPVIVFLQEKPAGVFPQWAIAE